MPVSGPARASAGDNNKKTRLGIHITQPQAQARPCLIVLAARPGNLHERCFSVSGTEPHFQFIGTEEKNDIRNVLQCHYRRRGLEASKDYIKTSFEMMCSRLCSTPQGSSNPCHPAKNIPSEPITFQGESVFRVPRGYLCGGLSGGGGCSGCGSACA
jgi:hypothetical protein